MSLNKKNYTNGITEIIFDEPFGRISYRFKFNFTNNIRIYVARMIVKGGETIGVESGESKVVTEARQGRKSIRPRVRKAWKKEEKGKKRNNNNNDKE